MTARVRVRKTWSLAAAGVAAVLSIALPAPASAAGPRVVAPPDDGTATVIARYQERIRELMAAQGIPGLAIALVDGDSVVWSEAFGTTDGPGSSPVTTDTIFSVQSMSKLFTATAVMRAATAGRLDLDAPITTYLPGFTVHSAFEPHPERRITLRMLLSHTAGFTHEAPLGSNFDLGHADFDAHVASISDTWLRFPVGTGYAYSNLGIDLAGAILARVSGTSFPAVMHDSLLAPLGMDHSTFDQAQIRARADRAIGHSQPLPRVPVDVPMGPSGGLYASVADLARFLRFQLGDGVIDGRVVLTPAALREQRTIPAPNAGALSGYALGVARTHWRAGRYLDLFSHGGGGFGFLSDLWWLPQLQLGVAVVFNSVDHRLQGDLALGLLHDLVDQPGTVYHERLMAQPVQGDVVDTARFEPPADMAERVAAAAMQPTGDEAVRWPTYVGEYRAPVWGVIDAGSAPGRFRLVDGRPTFEVVEESTSAIAATALTSHPLVEVARGVFLSDDGETLDFSGPTPTWRNVALVRASGGPGILSSALLAVGCAVALLWLLGGVASVVIRAIRRRRPSGPAPAGAPRWWRGSVALLATLASVLVLASVALIAVLPGIIDAGFLGWLDVPLPLRVAFHLPFALAVVAALLVALGALGLARRWWSPLARPRLAGLVAAVALVAIQLGAWNLIGWGIG